eukprot:TRINITY_DN24948_c0_g2_i1.p1 TRINITY_DN24948_c0_g2~~TRINITY_DN24948_c0_g2_i1.p1  ORF type:complete len:659 (-),score=157.43 TRINITY_DN24948_c0_g2_i1:53-2002(-)
MEDQGNQEALFDRVYPHVVEVLEHCLDILERNDLKVMFLNLGMTYPICLNYHLDRINRMISKNTSLKSIAFCGIQKNSLGVLFGEDLDGPLGLDALQTNTSIHTLNFELCALTDSQVAEIFEVLRFHNRSITSLDVSGNSMRNLNYVSQALEDPNVQLRFLNLSRNIDLVDQSQWKMFAESIASNTRLHKLELSRCLIQEEAGIALAEGLRKNANLAVLDLSENNILDKAGVAFMRMLEDHTGLIELDLERTGITAVTFEVLENTLKKNITLSRLTLGEDDMTGCGRLIGKAVEKSISLISLTILNKALSDLDFVDILEGLEHSKVSDLFLNKKSFSDEARARLFRFLCSFKQLQSFESHANPFVFIKDPWQSNLSKLVMSEVDISHPEDVAQVASSLKNSQLHLLTLRKCKITDEGAAILAPSLKTMSNLRFLQLTSNSFGPEGLFHVLPVVKESEILQDFFLTGTKIGDAGMFHFAEALRKHKTLLFIDLSDTGITSVGVSALCDAIIDNTVLQGLLLEDNKLDDSSAPALCRMIELSSSLHSVLITQNNFSHEASRAFEVAMRANGHIFRPMHASFDVNLSFCLPDLMRNEDLYVKTVQLLLVRFLTSQHDKAKGVLVDLKHFFAVVWSFWEVPQFMPLYSEQYDK